MADASFPKPDPQAFDNFIRAQALALRSHDKAPASRQDWEERRRKLRESMATAMGMRTLFQRSELSPPKAQEMGVLKRQGYRIEKLIFEGYPGVWVTATAYVPEASAGKVPAVLVVHGHWAGARRDPVVQARCLGLVKLGFFVLAVDAFGAGERFTKPALGSYHGALYGSTLWPADATLLDRQVSDNFRAIDYLLTRPEVDGTRLGITGASGGGNQTMYAGALDERFAAVVPVCSVGTYQAYLHAACCVCEVLPAALRFTEEGDVLGLVAPRALMVINATKDAFQFSVGEAEKSVAWAREIYKLYGEKKKLKHAVFESPHAYNQAMREAMYGWMTLWLKNEGDGKPIPEPKHDIEKPEDLACFADGQRPDDFVTPPKHAASLAQDIEAFTTRRWKVDHLEEWESTAVHLRKNVATRILGPFPPLQKPDAQLGKTEDMGGQRMTPIVLRPEPGLRLFADLRSKAKPGGNQPACILLHLGGKKAALKHPLPDALIEKGWFIAAPDLRATGESKPPSDAIAGAPDHNSAEHALWIGRPLLGQWVVDVLALTDWLQLQPGLNKNRLAVVGLGYAGVVALCAGALLDDRISAVAAIDSLTTFSTNDAYAPGTPMGLLAPGILNLGDVAGLAALCAPRKLVICGGITPQGKKVAGKELTENYRFASEIYKLARAADRLSFMEASAVASIADKLGG
jgi:dienelactone hydrolase